LGVDRWLALLAAWSERGSACLVVDAGSAMTLDFVSGHGRHLGGYIVPGLNLMQRSLFTGTAGARIQPQSRDADYRPEPGRDTDTAIRHGCLGMAADFVRASLAGIEGGADLFITGGDADTLSPHIDTDSPVRIRPTLVLDGLALVLE
jgi:type III pantothenate kinase